MNTESTNSAAATAGRGAPVQRSPLLDVLHIRPVAMGDGQARVEVTIGQEHLRHRGILHGGIMATLLDSAMGWAASGRAPGNHDVVTVQLNVHFIRPGWVGETLVALGEVVHSGRRTAVARGEVRTAAGILAATGSATFMFVDATQLTQMPGGLPPTPSS